jgi:16S rRNA processing protein RimM
VSRVLGPAGQKLLEVEGPAGVFLVPLVAAICKKVDVESGRIVIDPPEGLIELNAV